MFDGHQHHRRHGLLSPFVLKLLLGVFLIITVVYVYSDRAQNMQMLQQKTNDVDACAQKSDSLSAQLQVMYEHKSRLEKLLNEQKLSSSKSIADLEQRLKDANEKSDSETNKAVDCQTKVGSLQSQLNSLKEEKLHDDSQMQEELSKAKDDLSNAHRKLSDLEKEKETATEQVNTLSAQVKQLQTQVAQCGANNGDIDANAAAKRDTRANAPDSQQLINGDGDHLQQPSESKLAPSQPPAVPLSVLPTTTTTKVYVHNDSVVFDRPGDGGAGRPKVVDNARRGEEEGVVAAPEAANGRDSLVFDRAPPGESLAEVANNEGPGVRRLKQPEEAEESAAVGAAPKNDAAEADANEDDGAPEVKEGAAANPDDTDYKDDEEKLDNAKEDGHEGK